MKNVFLTATILFATNISFAASSIQDFLGSYKLVEQKASGNAFCFSNITISQENDNLVSLYREDSSLGAIVSAELNGQSRENSGSHGEAFGSRKGVDIVTLKNAILTFEYKGTNSFLGVPLTRESDITSLALAKDGKSLVVTRTTFEGPVVGLGSKGTARCTYQ